MRYSPVTKYRGLGLIYFDHIINEIIKIGNLNSKSNILDYGCGEKRIQYKLNKKIYNYDIKPEYNEIKETELFKLKIDTVIFGHVLQYMTRKEIDELFNFFFKLNNNIEFIASIGKQNLISNILKYMAFNKNAHKGTMISYEEQKLYILNNFKIDDFKYNIFFMTDIFKFSFKKY